MKKTKKIGKVILAIVIALSMGVTSQGIRAYATTPIGKVNISMLGKYDSADTATIRSVDTENRLIRFKNHATGKTYTLSYDNTSMMYDLYGSAMSARLLEPGQIVDVTFLKSAKTITTLNISKDAWYIDSTRDHDLVRNDGTAVVKGSIYKIDPRTMVLCEDKPALAEDVLSTDSVAVSGVGKDIYSVVVTSGHGYVSLSSDVVENQSLVGAWLELDNAVIHKISPNMLLSAPEGDYNLQIIGNGANYQAKVNISRNQETVIDTSNVSIARAKEGLVTFEITPDTAEVFVDGTRMLTGVPQTVQYGYHNLKIMADGYETQTKYLKVGTPKSVISIELEKTEDDSSSEASSEESTAEAAATTSSSEAKTDSSSESSTKEKETVSANSSQSAAAATTASTQAVEVISGNSTSARNQVINGYKIYIDEPNGAEIYFDGSYLGMAPASTTKISGNHEVIVRKDGYETKSYRIHIDTEESDLSYKFPNLVKIKSEEPSSDSGTDKDKDKEKEKEKEKDKEKTDPASEATTKDTESDATKDDTSKTPDEEQKDSPSESSTEGSTDKPSESSTEGSTDKPSDSSTEGASEGSKDNTSGTAEGSTSTEASTDTSGKNTDDNAAEGETGKNNSEEVSDAASTASASTGN
ncbi:MAG: PEGA domain-containing protein [Butyrivibrio sp.]|nr:PEGA domain-containing protein [Butyrivibrio sp.]